MSHCLRISNRKEIGTHMGDLNKPDGHSEWVIGNRHVVQPPVLLRRYRGGGRCCRPFAGLREGVGAVDVRARVFVTQNDGRAESGKRGAFAASNNQR